MRQLQTSVSSESQHVGNAIERFSSIPRKFKRGKESLEGHLRGVLANLTPEEVNEDRLKFAQQLMDEADEDFDAWTFSDTLRVQNVAMMSTTLRVLGVNVSLKYSR